MTGAEREAIRLAIDAARRERAPLMCEWCKEPMEPHPSGEFKRFCCDAHRKYAWRHTAKGLEQYRRRRRQWREKNHAAGRHWDKGATSA